MGGTGHTSHSGYGQSAHCDEEERRDIFNIQYQLLKCDYKKSQCVLPDAGPGLPVPDANGLVI